MSFERGLGDLGRTLDERFPGEPAALFDRIRGGDLSLQRKARSGSHRLVLIATVAMAVLLAAGTAVTAWEGAAMAPPAGISRTIPPGFWSQPEARSLEMYVRNFSRTPGTRPCLVRVRPGGYGVRAMCTTSVVSQAEYMNLTYPQFGVRTPAGRLPAWAVVVTASWRRRWVFPRVLRLIYPVSSTGKVMAAFWTTSPSGQYP